LSSGSALGSDGRCRLGGAVATGGEETVVQCSGGAEGFPSLAAPLLRSGLGFRWEWRLTVNLVLRAGGPHPVFIAQCDRGPPAIDGLGAPDQGAGQGPIRPLGLIGGRSFQHSPP
jgi:hypothetical protein